MAHGVCRQKPDCSVVLVKDVAIVFPGPLFWGRSFTVLTASNAALAVIASVDLHMHKISHRKDADFTVGICLVSVGLASSKRHRAS